MPGCWSWPPICAFLHEAAQHLGLVLMAFEQDLDGQVSPQIGVAPLRTAPIPPRAISPKSW